MSTISINVTGVEEVLRDYKKFRTDMKENLIVPLDDAAASYLRVIQTNFNSQGATFGQPWPPLSPATIAQKQKLLKQGKAISATRPLVRTGKLKAGFGRDVKGSTESYIYNTQPYAILHDEGGTAFYNGRTVTIPKRVLVDIDEQRIEMVTAIFTKWFNTIVSRNKL